MSNLEGTKLDPDEAIDLAHFEYPEGDSAPQGQGRGQRRLHGNPRYVKGQRGLRGPGADGFGRVKSSAMSDTSEAPSIGNRNDMYSLYCWYLLDKRIFN